MTTNYKNGYKVLTSKTCVVIYEGRSRVYTAWAKDEKEAKTLAKAWFENQQEMIESGELIALED